MQSLILEKVENKNDIRLKRLLQFYQYDWSEITGEGNISEKALYTHINLNKFWQHPESQAFIIKVSGEIAGFVMVKKYTYLTDASPSMVIDEFFILRNFRKQKVGTEVAIQIFDLFPGQWQVSEMNINTTAQKFWRKVIAAYTHNNYQEIMANNEKWHGPVQLFHSPLN